MILDQKDGFTAEPVQDEDAPPPYELTADGRLESTDSPESSSSSSSAQGPSSSSSSSSSPTRSRQGTGPPPPRHPSISHNRPSSANGIHSQNRPQVQGRSTYPTASEVLARDSKGVPSSSSSGTRPSRPTARPIVDRKSPRLPSAPPAQLSPPGSSKRRQSFSDISRPRPTSTLLPATSSSSLSPLPTLKSKASSSWFKFSSSSSSPKDTSVEISTTVINLLRDLVRPTPTDLSSADPTKVLEGCKEACKSYQLSFSSLVQDKCIEGHSALYWAILNVTPRSLLPITLIQLARPITPETMSEVRAACLIRNDQPLFQRLRSEGAVVPLSGVDEMLGGLSLDRVKVREADGEFEATLALGYFTRRMKVKGGLEVEWIAKNRLWHLALASIPTREKEPAKWNLQLTLLEDSQPTFVNSQLIILDYHHTPEYHKHSKQKPRPPLSIPIHTNGSQELIPTPNDFGKKRKPERGSVLSVDLDKQSNVLKEGIGMLVGSAQGATYLSPQDTLHVKFQVKLQKYEEESSCVIC